MTPLRALTGPSELAQRAAAMRAEFDAAFAEAPGSDETPMQDVLRLRIGVEERGIRLGEVAGISAHPPITPLPSRHPAMVGIVSNRGSVAAAWDLGLLLGGVAQSPRWVVVPAAEPAVALVFGDFTGFGRVPAAELAGEYLLSLAEVVHTVRGLCTGTEI
ncbi:chemotaxis protein CheW [Kineosporia rhizophila]|uniref:chemotaxis protein CheW n=1 Tax=Kineosporia TaxID=49184 RepID=UPI001E55A6B1|nr:MULTISPECIES: chemotaxis protein CheW [Kineosporia]MCE0535720.1 chemotaxis protein CheW [Kineosporia rhizophila]GLY17631.1 hypothetical protein Kisp01_46450 [Kineosporia sp. NBRC 101677]